MNILFNKTKRFLQFNIMAILILVFSFSTPVSAATELSSTNEDGYAIYVNSDEEYEALIEAIDNHNELVEQKWQEALAEANKEKSMLIMPSSQMKTTAFSTTTSRSSLYYSQTADIRYKWSAFPGWDYFNGYLKLIGNTTSNSYGTKFFSSFSSVNLYSSSTKNGVDGFSYQKALIDSSRTYAINFSSNVTIYRTSTNSKRYPVKGYVEFYASGGSYVY
ncbi:hypothetical protein [Proteiniclasticum ruminis]|uniref:Uncharacterized protein n=1 Tax=Proteiniclasticum ruminis TaxID=398199 RepID=A0A1I5F3S0_9CLOT|nr:hypothetical protein [Proteiniclasticum ruminis]SFO18377.1 hypothetical protein SAMN04488695_1288 [Proteiniclasticum ruminis]